MTTHQQVAQVASDEIQAMQQEIHELGEINKILHKHLRSLVNNIPDDFLTLAGPHVGWSNVSALRQARDAARKVL